MIPKLTRRAALAGMGGAAIVAPAGSPLNAAGGRASQRPTRQSALVLTGDHAAAPAFLRGMEQARLSGAGVAFETMHSVDDTARLVHKLADFASLAELVDEACFLLLNDVARSTGMHSVCEGHHRVLIDGTSVHSFDAGVGSSGVSVPVTRALVADGGHYHLIENARAEPALEGWAGPGEDAPTSDWREALGRTLAAILTGAHRASLPYIASESGAANLATMQTLRSFLFSRS